MWRKMGRQKERYREIMEEREGWRDTVSVTWKVLSQYLLNQ